jgi:hypothetical protein
MTAGFGLGTLVHEFTYPGQAPDQPPYIEDFESVEVAPGGYLSMAGKVDAGRVIALSNVYRQGATWCVYLRETGECVGKGFLLPPAISGGVAQLAARGLSFKADRQIGRLLYANRAYQDWVPADSDPYLLPNGAWNYDSTGGRLAVTIPPGTAVNTGQNGGFVFSAQSGDPNADPNTLSRIQFTIHGTGDFEWRLYVYAFPNTLIGLEGTTFPCVDGNFVDYSFTNAGDMVYLRLHCTTNHTVGTTAEVYSVTNLEADGVATSASFSADQVIGDIAGRLGFSDAFVQPSSDSVMPIDQKQGTFADVCDWVDVLTDRRTQWLSYNGSSDVVDSGSWLTRTWFMADPEAPYNPLPAEIFDTVRIPFRYGPGSSASGLLTVSMAPGTSPLPAPNVFGDVGIGEPVADATIAETLGTSILAWLSTPRDSGSGTLAEVEDGAGNRVSAHTMRAGDMLFTPGPTNTARKPIRITQLVRKADGVSWQGDNRVAALDRLIARRAEALAMGGRGG